MKISIKNILIDLLPNELIAIKFHNYSIIAVWKVTFLIQYLKLICFLGHNKARIPPTQFKFHLFELKHFFAFSSFFLKSWHLLCMKKFYANFFGVQKNLLWGELWIELFCFLVGREVIRFCEKVFNRFFSSFRVN